MKASERPVLPASLKEFRELEEMKLALEHSGRDAAYQEFLRYWAEADFFAFMLWVYSTSGWRYAAEPDPFEEGEPRRYLWHPFIFDACRSIQFKEKDVMRLWAREHLKTTLGTQGRNVHRIIEDLPLSAETTVAIISETKGLSKTFIAPIKLELETNELYPTLWPDVFYAKPQIESPRWTMSDDPNPKLQVKRTSTTMKEATIEAIGLEAIRPGPHWLVLNFDDIVTIQTTNNPDMMEKSYSGYKSALSLGREGGFRTFYGTTYHPADTYMRIINDPDDPVEVERIPCWSEGPAGNKVSVFYSLAYLEKKQRELGPAEFGLQWELDVHAGQNRQTFDPAKLKYWSDGGVKAKDFVPHSTLYQLVDSATGKDAGDFTVITMWAIGKDGRARLVDGIRDRLSPPERIAAIIDQWAEWDNGRFVESRIETYGMDETIDFLEAEMNRRAQSFPVVRVGGVTKAYGRKGFKPARIEERLTKAFDDGMILLPDTLVKPCKYRNGADVDLIEVFLREEYLPYPLCLHDDMLDNMSRLFEPDMPLVIPGSHAARQLNRERDRYAEALRASVAASREGDWIAPAVP